jgi:uncharacterized protein YbjT (DUF2867 family)
MAQHDARIIAVVGATGLQGGAVARRLLTDHWPVRALTRNPDGRKVRALAELGAEVVKADLSDPMSLERAVDGVYGVFSVQNHHISGYEEEVRQGKQVAEVAKRVGVSQLVYSGAGPGVQGSGVGSWETKREVAAYIGTLDLPATILHPTAFMELMTERKFFPAASVWHLMPKLMGADRPVGWLTVEDLAVIVATAFGDPDRIPRWLFERFAGTDETTMWRWLGANDVDFDLGPTLAIDPGALTVREWLGRKKAPVGPRR